jgi:hypothetical protein
MSQKPLQRLTYPKKRRSLFVMAHGASAANALLARIATLTLPLQTRALAILRVFALLRLL